jgi:hypothetical protein
MTIVHESTHALIDATSANQKVSMLTHELAGLMAGGLYNAFSAESLAPTNLFKPWPNDPIYATAHYLAVSVANGIKKYNYTSCWNITPAFLAPLKSEILASPTYSYIAANPTGTYGDNGVNL